MSILNPVATETLPGKRSKGASLRDLASDTLLAMVLDHTTDGVLVADREGVIVYVNKPLLALFGYDTTDLLGRHVEILMPEDHRDDHHRHVEQFVRSPNARPMGREDLDIEGRRADGSRFSIDVQLMTMPDSALVVATVRDMTEQRKSAVDRAIAGIDLANATNQIAHLQESLDIVVQHLFALGTSIAAGASNEAVLRERMGGAIRGIDEVIDAVQRRRRTSRA